MNNPRNVHTKRYFRLSFKIARIIASAKHNPVRFIGRFSVLAAFFAGELAVLAALCLILLMYLEYSDPAALLTLHLACQHMQIDTTLCGKDPVILQGLLYTLWSGGLLFYAAFGYHAWHLFKAPSLARAFTLLLFAGLAHLAYRIMAISTGKDFVDDVFNTVFYLSIWPALLILPAIVLYLYTEGAVRVQTTLYHILKKPETLPDLPVVLLFGIVVVSGSFFVLQAFAPELDGRDQHAALYHIAKRDFRALMELLRNSAVLQLFGDSPKLFLLVTLLENLVFMAVYLYFSRALMYGFAIIVAILQIFHLDFSQDTSWQHLLTAVLIHLSLISVAFLILRLRLKQKTTGWVRRIFASIKQSLPEFRSIEFILLAFPYFTLSTLVFMFVHFVIQQGFAIGYHVLIAGGLAYAVLYRRYLAEQYDLDYAPF